MKKAWMGILIFTTLCGYAFSFDYNSIKYYLGKDFQVINRDFPDMRISNELYSFRFIENGTEYYLRCSISNNKMIGFECTMYVNNQDEAKELFDKMKNENTIPTGGKLLSDTINEYMWQLPNSIITHINIVSGSSKYGVMLYFLMD
jgi:hypothetical protein